MKHLGDITKTNGAEIEKVDCISFGSPCQDLSVAGKRAGLDGERSGLFVEAVRIIKEMRDDDERNNRSGINVRPRWAIWENVGGALSSGAPKGEDFRLVLELLARVKETDFTIPRCEKWSKSGVIYGNTFSIAWKLSDAQYYGVPQRRKRICVFCDFNGHEAGDILLTESIRTSSPTCGEPPLVDIGGECGREVQTIPKGLSGNLEPCIPPWKGIARDPQKSTGECCTLKVRGGGWNEIATENQQEKVL